MKHIIHIVFLIIIVSSCKKFVTVDIPNTRISSDAVFSDDKTATAAAIGMYDIMQRISGFGAAGGQNSITGLSGLSADEFMNYSPPHEEIKQNNILTDNDNVLSMWSSLYSTIYVSNSVIEGVSKSSSLSPALKKQLEGEGKFIRAFCHFYLVNIFGDVPLVTTTDYRINSKAPRTPVSVVYDQIENDLKDARELLSPSYVSTDRGRPNRSTATALLARAYLYRKGWAAAEAMASEVIENSTMYFLETNFNSIFIKSSKEAIWQLVSSAQFRNTWEGTNFIFTFPPYFIALDPTILNVFEPGDTRRIQWIGLYTDGTDQYFFPFKYKISGSSPQNEHSILLRLAELYFIRAEARAQQNKLTGPNSAQSDLNMIRNRAGLPGTNAQSKEEFLEAILKERRVELFAEWGHRWFDLKRTNRADAVLGIIKPGWQTTDMLYPIPEVEMNNNPFLIPQNPGY